MYCPNCGCENVNVQIVSEGVQTNKKGVGFGGHMNNMARGTAAIMTAGISNLFWKKSKGTNKSKIKNTKVAICQQCGASWEVGENGGLGIAPGSIVK